MSVLLEDILDVDLLAKHIEDGNVSVRTHPDDEGLSVLNYTPRVQYDRLWDDVTKKTRGLIVRQTEVVARGLDKFFNLSELTEIPTGPFTVFPKVDGSLGIPYIAPDGDWAIATRGSFMSTQAEFATAWLREHPNLMGDIEDATLDGLTPIFEIIAPWNRIVIDYGDTEDLILLNFIQKSTGRAVPYVDWHIWRGSKIEPIEAPEDIWDLDQLEEPNKEGFVIYWDSGERAKFKFEEYLRLHRILTGVTERTIWEYLSQRRSLEPLKDMVPDEFFQWMKTVEAKLETEFSKIEKRALKVYSEVNLSDDRKTQAEFIKTRPHSDIVFSMLDGKPYTERIWKMIYPEAVGIGVPSE
jgi:hypothetical protein